MDHDQKQSQSGEQGYTCPMHPNVRQHSEGTCSECGMQLVPVGKHGETNEAAMDHSAHHAHMVQDFKKRFFATLIVSIPVLLLSPTVQGWLSLSLPTFTGQDYLLFALASIIALWAGKPFYIGARDELKTREFGMMTLVSLAVLAGYLYSAATTFFIDAPDFYWEISTLVLFLLFGHWMEMKSVLKSSGALEELVKLIPPDANKLVGSDVQHVKTEELQPGDRILIKPGEQVPIDGEVMDGQSSVNEALITGESKPSAKKKGDDVIGGTINQDGSLTVRVTKTGAETALSQIIDLVQTAQNAKPRSQRLASKAATWLTLIAIVVGLGTFAYWSFFTAEGVVYALTLSITVIVITCPHALGLAIPTVTTIATTLAAKNGLLIRDMDGVERAQKLTHVVFDKTGTLTKGEFGVTDIVPFNDMEQDGLLAAAAALEQHSEHTIAAGIVAEAKRRKLEAVNATDFRAVAGQGATGVVSGRQYAIGNQTLMQTQGIDASAAAKRFQDLSGQGKTVVYVAADKQLVGLIALADEVKDESKAAVRALQHQRLTVVMLTGDNEETAKAVASQLGISEYRAGVKPENKVDHVRELQQEGHVVAMVGDGVNDAPALEQADVGIAIGAGTDVAAASAQILLVQNNPLDVVKLLHLSRETNRKMRQNLWWATGYNVIAIPLAAGVLAGVGFTLRPEWGALIMAASSIIVVANALRLRRVHL